MEINFHSMTEVFNEANEELFELEKNWLVLRQKLKAQFGKAPDLNAVLMLIGIRELGSVKDKFSKEEKQDLMHIATCKLLSVHGYYKLKGLDQEGWLHWQLVKKLPQMNLKQQEDLLRECALIYFHEIGY